MSQLHPKLAGTSSKSITPPHPYTLKGCNFCGKLYPDYTLLGCGQGCNKPHITEPYILFQADDLNRVKTTGFLFRNNLILFSKGLNREILFRTGKNLSQRAFWLRFSNTRYRISPTRLGTASRSPR